MNFIKRKLKSDNLIERITFCIICFFGLFLTVTILSYFLLPEGVLIGKQSANFEMSANIFCSSIQIFMWNMISVTVIVIGSLFAQKKIEDKNYLSIGYTAFFVLTIINAVTLGTWSFSVQTEAVPLIERLVGFFNIINNGGLLEMLGQLFVVTSLASISIVLISAKKTTTKKLSDIKLNKYEKIGVLIGITLIYIGALIESISIVSI